MVYELSPQALAVMTMEQVKALSSLDKWDASKIAVRDDGPTRPGSIHGEGNMLYACVYREKEKAESDGPIFVLGVMPNGDMHS